MLLLGTDSDDDGLEAMVDDSAVGSRVLLLQKKLGEVSDAKVSHLHSLTQNPKRLHDHEQPNASYYAGPQRSQGSPACCRNIHASSIQ